MDVRVECGLGRAREGRGAGANGWAVAVGVVRFPGGRCGVVVGMARGGRTWRRRTTSEAGMGVVTLRDIEFSRRGRFGAFVGCPPGRVDIAGTSVSGRRYDESTARARGHRRTKRESIRRRGWAGRGGGGSGVTPATTAATIMDASPLCRVPARHPAVTAPRARLVNTTCFSERESTGRSQECP
jgi:hypothetical protein